MFAKTIIDSDAFLEMPQSSQNLYFHLAMRADDDGFINNPKSIMRLIGCKDDDANILIAKKFLIPFESGVVVIKHWKIHNYIRKDTYTETKYKDEKSMLELDENYAYTTHRHEAVTLPSRNCDEPLTQVRLGKDRLGKDRINIYGDYSQNPELVQALEDFEKMRKAIKKPLTEKAKQMLLTELNRLSDDDETKIAILNQSIFHNWQGVFPLKSDNAVSSKKSSENSFMDLLKSGVISDD